MVTLPRRPLGTTGVDVAVLAFGAMELRGPPRGRSLSDADVGRLLGAVLDEAGIDVIDTSIDYGTSEEHIGRHLAHRRDDFLLASKCGCVVDWEPAPDSGGARGGGPHDYRPANVVAGVEQSLRRLRTDHLDLVQIHLSPDEATLREHDVVETLEDLRRQGKVRWVGMSGTLPHVADHIRMGVFDVFQIPYSAVQREHEDVIADAAAAGAGVLARGGAGRGAPAGVDKAVQRNPDLAAAWERGRVSEILDGMSATEFTLRFTLSHPGVSSVLVGTANHDHLVANARALAHGPLPDDLYEEACRRLSS